MNDNRHEMVEDQAPLKRDVAGRVADFLKSFFFKSLLPKPTLINSSILCASVIRDWVVTTFLALVMLLLKKYAQRM
jgi:hypothetical protein